MPTAPTGSFTYRLTGAGWVESRFAIGEAWVELSASYPRDALADLVDGIQRLAYAEDQAVGNWEEEPDGLLAWKTSVAGQRP